VEKPVFEDVWGEVVVGDFDRERQAGPDTELVSDADAASDSGERVLVPAVAV